MRQYRIITKTPDSEEQLLQPGVHATLYNIPEIRNAVEFIEANQATEMIGIRLGARFYGIVVIVADELKEGHFQLQDFDVD